MNNQNPSFEDRLNRLEEIVGLLDKGEIPLEEMLKIYEEGMNSVKELKEYLDKAEMKIIDISKE